MGRRHARSAPSSLMGGALPSARPYVSCRRVCLATRWMFTTPLADATPCAGRGQARRVLPGEDGSCRCGAWWKSAGDLDREDVSWQHTYHASIWPCRYDQGGSQRDRHGRETGEATLRKHPVPGTIKGRLMAHVMASQHASGGELHAGRPWGAVSVTRRLPYRESRRSAWDSMCAHHEGHAPGRNSHRRLRSPRRPRVATPHDGGILARSCPHTLRCFCLAQRPLGWPTP
jgi:hypothetical protein